MKANIVSPPLRTHRWELPVGLLDRADAVPAGLPRVENIERRGAVLHPSPLGEGEDVRLTGEGVAGGALMAEGRLVHLAGFAVAP